MTIRDRVVELRRVRAGDLKPNPAQWRVHTKPQIAALRGILSEVGFAGAALAYEDANGKLVLIDGHMRSSLRKDAVIPVLVLDVNAEEARKLLATYDPLGAMAGQDQDALLALLRDVHFESKAVNDLLEAVANGERTPMPPLHESVEDPGPEMDRADELQERWQVVRGQVWEIPTNSQLGQAHRLMCGDSAQVADVGSLMEKQNGALFATDPPYGINYDSATLHRNETHYDAIRQDDLRDDAYQSWLTSVFRAWSPHLRETAAWYLWHPMLTQGYFAAAAAAADILISRQIIWVKPQFIFGRGEYHWQHELCFFGWRTGHRPPFYGEHNQTTVWAVDYDGNRNGRDHPTQKPVAIFAVPMKNHTLPGEICAEPFAGSGTQFIAAEQLGRICYGMEIEPKYVAVALERMVGLGLTPTLLNA